MLLSVSWRNIWRSKSRSLVLIMAITLGILAGVFTVALSVGMINQRIDLAIRTEVSNIQIHEKEYLETFDNKKYITETDQLLNKLRSNPKIQAVSSRLVYNSMISGAGTGAGVRIIGVDPEQEQQVTELYTKIKKGAYFKGIKRNPVVIGEKLAKKLKVDVRKKVVVTGMDLNGDMVRSAFRVAGIYKTSNTAFDEMTVFVRKSDLGPLLGYQKQDAHEISILLKENEETTAMTDSLSKSLSHLDVKNWKEIMPEVGIMDDTMNFYLFLIMGIILFALMFGIINTMLMVVLERTKELGMLMAIGMNKLRVFSMILLETIMLSLTGGIAGTVLGYFLVQLFAKNGLDLSIWQQGLESIGYDAVIYPKIGFSDLLQVTLMVIGTGILAAIYPSIKALKLNPAEALRIE